MLILGIVTALISSLLSGAAIAQWQKRKGMKWDHVVHLPFFLAVIGIICGNIFAIPTVICGFDGNGGTIAFALFTLGCHSMTIGYINCVIWYDDRGFVARNFFGIRRQCTYAEVEGLRNGKDHWLYFKGHRILIDESAHGGRDFIKAVKRGYSSTHGGRMLMASQSYGRRVDPMNGNIENPWLYFCIWVGMILLCVFLLVVAVISMTEKPSSVEELEFYQMTFASWKKDDGELHLSVPGREEAVRINNYRGYGDLLPAPEELCGGETFTVGLDGKYIKSLSGADGTVYITPELERQVYHKTQDVACVIIGVFSVFGIVFSIVGIDAARRPERYGVKFKRLFYQDHLWR